MTAIQGMGLQPGAAFPGASAERGEGARGEWNGLAVKVSDNPASLLADAMEELTFAASEKVEKDLSARRKPDRERRVTQVVPPQEALARLHEQMEDRLQKLLAAVKNAGGDPTRFREALDAFPDPTERHAALAWLESRLAGDPVSLALATVERETLEAESAAAIQAGYNIDGVDATAAGGPAAGRDTYRRVLLGHDGVGPLLDDILKKHGDGDFRGTVDFLRHAVAADLSATRSSTDKRELEALNNDLYYLRATANFTTDFGDGLGKLRVGGGKPPLPQAPVDTLRQLCRAKDSRLPDLAPLKGVLRLEGAQDPTYDVRALSLVQKLAYGLPAKIFTDEEARRRMLDAGQKMLDAAIDLEETLMPEDGD